MGERGTRGGEKKGHGQTREGEQNVLDDSSVQYKLRHKQYTQE